MTSTACSGAVAVRSDERLAVLFEELSELAGQRNAIDGRIVEIAAEMERDELCGATGARSVAALLAWKTGSSPTNAHTIAAVARRAAEFPRCVQGLREGRLSLDQVGVIAERAADGSDEHYAALAEVATVSQLRTAIKLEPRPEPDPQPERQRSITKTTDGQSTCWRITLPKVDAAKFDAALQSHQDALIAEWKRDHDDGRRSPNRPPLPGAGEAFMRLVEAGWDADAVRRPHGQHTTVVVHLDVNQRAASLHLGPLLTESERRYLLCDATCEVWFERDGQVIGVGSSDAGDQPPASSCPGASPSHVCGARLRRHSWSARPSHPPLGRRRPHRVGQPRPGVSVPPPAAPSRGHHHHRTRATPDRHRQRGTRTQRGIARTSTEPTPAGRGALSRTHR